MLEQVREAEIAQAIDRVRPVFNRRRIFVLTSLALDLTVDQAVTWPELRPGKFASAFARYGVLPLSACDLTKAFPDLWATVKQAETSLEAWKKTLPILQIDIYLGFGGSFSPRPLEATYRRKNQRGPLARALVRADLPDPGSILEGLVGELVKFHLERPAVSPASAPKPKPLPTLPPLAAAMAAEGQLLASLAPDVRSPDALGMAGVIKIMGLAGHLPRAERTVAA